MPPKSKTRAANKSGWAPKATKEEITRAVGNAHILANQTHANIGDSIESRMNALSLGGGSDVFDGGMGYMGEYLGFPMYGGEESTQRGAPSLSPLSRIGPSNETRMAWTRMMLTSKIYENDGQVASIVDLMADFASDGLGFSHGDESVQKFYDSWAKKVKLRTRFRSKVCNLITFGNSFVYRIYAKLEDKEINAMKTFTVGQRIGDKIIITDSDGNQTLMEPAIAYDSSVSVILEALSADAKPIDEAEKIRQFVIGRLNSDGAKIVDTKVKLGDEKVVPWKYININPLQMIPDLKEGGWIYLMTKDEVAKLLKSADISFSETDKALKVSLPEGISGNIKKTTHSNFFAEMKLDETRLAVVQYGKFDWQKWGIGMVWKAMPTITFKNTLRAMETKTAKAAINTVFLWKLGDHEHGIVPGVDDFERLADMLKAPASNLNVLWNSAIDCEVKQPAIKDIFDPKRWEELRKEVTSQFGITQAVVTGEGGNFSSSFISVQGLLEKLQSIRDMLVEEWLMEEILIIQKAMGFRKLPTVRFGQMSLRDKTAENTFIMGLYDRGLISDESMYETIERDTDIERERLLNERQWEDDENFDRRGPFIKDPEQHVLDEKKLKMDKEANDKDLEMRDKEFKLAKDMDTKKLDNDMALKEFEVKETVKVKKELMRKNNSPSGKPNVKPNGRPPGSKKPQTNKRKSKPKNMARVDVENIVKKLDENAKAYLVTKAGVSDYRYLSKADKDGVMDKVAIALAELDELGLDTILASDFMKDEMTTGNIEFADKWPEMAKAVMTEKNRKLNKDEIYQVLIDTYLSV